MHLTRMAAGMGIACALLIGARAAAHETDQFTVPVGKSFADFGDELTAHYHDAIESAVDKLNARIRSALEEKGDPTNVEWLQTPETLVGFVYEEFQPAYFAIETFERHVHHSEATRKRYPGRVTGHWESIRNIYQHAYFPLDPRQFWRLWHAATINVYGTYMGPDKIGHFNDMGYVYYLICRRGEAAGLSGEEAATRAVREGKDGMVLGEKGFLGYVTAGAYSNADLVSNYLGMKFYLNLTRETRIKGEMQPPMVERDGEYWRLAPHVRRDSQFFSIFISDHYNEALNPSLWEARARKAVRNSVRERSARILEFYADDNGARRPRAFFDERLEELSTYYGEDYGHEGTYDQFISIGNTCFGEAPPADDPDARDANGFTALHRAAAEGDTAAACELLEAGAAADEPVRSLETVSSEWGSTPLHLAAAGGHAETARIIVDHGADVNRANDEGVAPLHRAIASPAIVELLISGGADVNAADRRGRTPLHWLARYPEMQSVALLVGGGADVGATDHDGQTPLHRAAEWGHPEMIEALLAAGASPESRAKFNTTPLHFAVRQESPEVIDLLIRRGARVDASDAFGWTPLHDVARRGRWRLAEVLIANGADPNAADQYGSTPVHLAARHGLETMTAVLLDAGANPNAADLDGTVPLHEAAFAGRISIVNLLVSRGADVMVQNSAGQSAADLASAQGNTLTALVLSSMLASQAAQQALGMN